MAALSGQVRDGARIAELGAGYGRLAYVHAHAAQSIYCIFDIPPALAVAQWYLSQVLGADRVVRFSPEPDLDALRPGTVAFFTPDQLELFPDGWFDLTQTISTLPEMPARSRQHFLESAGGEVVRRAVPQAVEALAQRGRRRRADRGGLRPPAGWTLTHRRTDPIQPMFFNRLWQRADA